MSTVFHSVNVTKREGVHRFNEVTLRRWENNKKITERLQFITGWSSTVLKYTEKLEHRL